MQRKKRVSLLFKQIALFGLSLYQHGFRSWFATGCYFYPSCSVYAQEKIRSRGVWRSLVPILYRVLRCHPFGKKGKMQLDDPLECS